MSRQWFKIKFLISIRSSDLTVQSFLTRDFLLRISRINSTRIVVSLYISWLHSLHVCLTLSYHTIVHSPHIRRERLSWALFALSRFRELSSRVARSSYQIATRSSLSKTLTTSISYLTPCSADTMIRYYCFQNSDCWVIFDLQCNMQDTDCHF